MELHIQKCQNCQSRQLRNILVRDEKDKVFVQCRDCEALVARYVLATSGGYFHEGKGFESFLRSTERGGGVSSARDMQEAFEQTEGEVKSEFENLNKPLKERYGDELP